LCGIDAEDGHAILDKVRTGADDRKVGRTCGCERSGGDGEWSAGRADALELARGGSGDGGGSGGALEGGGGDGRRGEGEGGLRREVLGVVVGKEAGGVWTGPAGAGERVEEAEDGQHGESRE
jgi:hypothetical protein